MRENAEWCYDVSGNRSERAQKAKYLRVKDKTKFTVPQLSMSRIEARDNQSLDDLYVAMVNAGFMYIKDHGVAKDAIMDMRRITYKFFRTPLKERLRMRSEANEKFPGQLYQEGHVFQYESPYNVKEIYNGQEVVHELLQIPDRMQIDPHSKLNTEECIKVIRRYHLELEKLARRLSSAFEYVLGLKRGVLNAISKHTNFLHQGTLCYAQTPPGKDGLAPHYDQVFMTILMFDQPGLEARNKGKWYRIDPVTDTFVVNFGRTMECMTYGVVKATFHRGRNDWANGCRYSWPSFFGPRGWLDPLTYPKIEQFKWNQKSYLRNLDRNEKDYPTAGKAERIEQNYCWLTWDFNVDQTTN